MGLKSDADLRVAFKELGDKRHTNLHVIANQPSNGTECVDSEEQYQSPQQVTPNNFALDEVYDDYKLDELAPEWIMPDTISRLSKIDNILRVRQFELYGCFPKFEDVQPEDTIEPLVDPLPIVKLIEAQNSEIEYNVITAREDHLPIANNEEAELAAKNRFYASKSEDDINMFGMVKAIQQFRTTNLIMIVL